MTFGIYQDLAENPGTDLKEDGSWRVKKNLEIKVLTSDPNIDGEIKAASLQWLGHERECPWDNRYRWGDEVQKALKAFVTNVLAILVLIFLKWAIRPLCLCYRPR